MLRRMMAKKMQESRKDFRFRGHELKRIEAFSDAVFGFAVTLLIVSLEVPKSFDELMLTMRGFLPFGISFLLLMMIWYEQNMYFRRYGLDNIVTVVLNCTLIFLVLFYVYPLKFLFTLMFSDQIYGAGHSPIIISQEQLSRLMFIYGLGFISIYLLFFLMYLHAYKSKVDLELTVIEIFDTRTKIFSNLILILVGLLSVITAKFLPVNVAGSAGIIYFLIGPALFIYYSVRGRRRRVYEVLPGLTASDAQPS